MASSSAGKVVVESHVQHGFGGEFESYAPLADPHRLDRAQNGGSSWDRAEIFFDDGKALSARHADDRKNAVVGCVILFLKAEVEGNRVE
jgi:hypothetical protein